MQANVNDALLHLTAFKVGVVLGISQATNQVLICFLIHHSSEYLHNYINSEYLGDITIRYVLRTHCGVVEDRGGVRAGWGVGPAQGTGGEEQEGGGGWEGCFHPLASASRLRLLLLLC